MSDKPGCLGFLIGLLNGSRALSEPPAPYQRRDFLLTKAERSFYGVLANAVDADRLVFAKVRLADLIFVKGKTPERQGHLNRILAKHVDFVVCDTAAIRPLLAIELDDASHDRADRRDRDEFVERALRAAGLPLLRIPAARTYDVQDLKRRLTAAS